MEEKLRKTGIDVIGDVPWGTHLCQFYQTKRDLIDILVPYFKAGLENNEFCMWITSEPLKVEDAKAALKKVVKNLDHFVKKGQIEILDYSEWYTKSGKFDANNVLQGWVEKENQALKRGYDGLRVSGNTFWLRKRDWRNFADYEEKVNNLIGKYRMISICVYSLSKCGASEVIDVVSNHQFALIRRQGKWVTIESSERKQAEEALRESEKKYRNLVESIIDVVYALDSSGVLTYISPVVKNTLGYEPDELIGRQFLELVHKEDQDLLMRRFSELSEGIVKHSDYRLIGKHGDIKWVRTLTNPIIEEGGFMGARGVLIDITEPKKVEEALRESEEIFTQFMNCSPIYVFFKDENIKAIQLSKNYTEMLGRPISELVGKNMDELFPSDLAKSMVADDRRILKEGKKVQIEEGMNGRFYSTIKFPIYREGKPTYLAGFTIDITERKKAEETLRESKKFTENLIASMQDGFLVLDSDGVQIDVNAAFCQMTGFSREELIGVGLPHPYWPPEAHEEIERGFQKTLRGEFSDVELTFMRKNGERFPVIVSPSWVNDKQGNLTSYFATVKDNTERKRAEDQLRDSEKRLRALAARLQSVREEERAMIAREIHDELGQVLTGLKMDLFWLSSKLPEDQKSLLGKTKSMLELIDTTIQSVRKLSTELRPGVLDNLGLKAAIEWQIGEFQTRAGIRCEFIVPEEDIALDQDCSTAVFRIFQEALTNVVRHSNATRVNITLEKSADHLLLEVQDNGKGIEESKIFDLESLGLLGMRERALYLGGKVKIEGIQGKGTKVTVLIPLKGKKGNGSEGL